MRFLYLFRYAPNLTMFTLNQFLRLLTYHKTTARPAYIVVNPGWFVVDLPLQKSPGLPVGLLPV